MQLIASRMRLAQLEPRVTQKEPAPSFLMQHLKGKEDLKEICLYGIIILKWFLKKQVSVLCLILLLFNIGDFLKICQKSNKSCNYRLKYGGICMTT